MSIKMSGILVCFQKCFSACWAVTGNSNSRNHNNKNTRHSVITIKTTAKLRKLLIAACKTQYQIETKTNDENTQVTYQNLAEPSPSRSSFVVRMLKSEMRRYKTNSSKETHNRCTDKQTNSRQAVKRASRRTHSWVRADFVETRPTKCSHLHVKLGTVSPNNMARRVYLLAESPSLAVAIGNKRNNNIIITPPSLHRIGQARADNKGVAHPNPSRDRSALVNKATGWLTILHLVTSCSVSW